MNDLAGFPVFFEYSGTPTTAAVVKVYRRTSSTTASEVTTTNFTDNKYALVITDYTIVNSHTAAQLVEFFTDRNSDGNVDAGERIVGGILAANGGVAARSLGTPFVCAVGLVPKTKSASGAVYVTGTGHVIRA